MASASAMHLAGSANNATDVPNWIGHGPSEPHNASDYRAPGRPVGPRLRRALLLVGTGVIAGLILVVGVVLVSMPALNNGLTAQKPTVAGTQAFSQVATPVRAPATATAPGQAPAKPTAAAAAPRPTAAPAPTAAVASPAQSAPNTTAASQAQNTTAAQPQGATTTSASQTATSSSQSPSTTAAGPSQSPTAASSPQGATAATGQGQPLLDVRFASGPGKGWPDNPAVAAWSDGAYRLQARQPARFVAIGAPLTQALSDVVISATFRKTGGPPGGGYGLIVRDQGPDPRDGANQTMNAFVLEAGDLGEFGIWRRDGDRWVDLVAWTRSAAVRMGGSPNDLTVRAVGNRLTFTINGTQVASVEDAAPMAGGAGVFVGGDYNEVALDRFTVQAAD